ncbi:MAG: copper chaperone PCu(A)C [Betaproteobacteria bacterium]|nr:copper chaperone PCu(A)C [Betaproteobacteria bacterium]
MKKIIIAITILFTSLTLFSAPLTADISVVNIFARATAKGQDVGAVYLVLKNNTHSDIKFTGATTSIADQADIHIMEMEHNVSSMKHEGLLIIPAQKELQMLPGKSHIMLMGLKQPLVKGKTLTVTLHFENHPDLTVNVPIQSIDDEEMTGMHMH